jgi:hypothetical protein
MDDTVTLSIRLPGRIYHALQDRSKRESRTKSGMAVLLLAQALQQAPVPTTTQLPDSANDDHTALDARSGRVASAAS